MTDQNIRNKDKHRRSETRDDAAHEDINPQGSSASDDISGENIQGPRFIRRDVEGGGQAIDWNASIQGFLGSLMKYANLLILAITNPSEYEKMAEAMGVKKPAASEPARSTHGDASRLRIEVEPPLSGSAKAAPASADQAPPALEGAPEQSPGPQTTVPENSKPKDEENDDDVDIDDVLNPYRMDDPKYASGDSVADQVFEQSPALAAASLKFNNHFAAAVAGPQAQEPSVALDLTNIPTLGRVA